MTAGGCAAGGVAPIVNRAGMDVGWTCPGGADGVQFMAGAGTGKDNVVTEKGFIKVATMMETHVQMGAP